MLFWDRAKMMIKSENTTQEWVANHCGVKVATFRGWITREIMPNADQAVAIAKALNTTVEYLVTGERTGSMPLSAPIAEIVGHLQLLPPEQLELVRLQTQALASAKQASDPRSEVFGNALQKGVS